MALTKSKYREEFCEKLIQHMKKGLSFESFGSTANVGKTTLFNWVKAHKEFQEAKEIAESHCLVFWEQLGIQAVGDKNFNAVIWIVNMCNRFKWRQRQPDEEPRDESQQAAPMKLSKEDLVGIVNAARGQGK